MYNENWAGILVDYAFLLLWKYFQNMLQFILDYLLTSGEVTLEMQLKKPLQKSMIYASVRKSPGNDTLLPCNRMSRANLSLKFTIPTPVSPLEGLLNKTVSTA